MVVRLLIGVVGFSLIVAACSAAETRPDQFEGMTTDEVGCVVVYGDAGRFVLGPLGPSESEEIHPNDYTSFRIGRTASDVIVVVEQASSGSTVSIPLTELPGYGIVSRGPFRDGGNPGYVVTCWRGDT
jgi:hypothetical protein